MLRRLSGGSGAANALPVWCLVAIGLSLAPCLWAQEVVFSRRVYKERGPSYQQIWSWNPANGAFREFTHSPRNHYGPLCKDKGITFVSGEDSRKNEELWSFDPATGAERMIGPAPLVRKRELPEDGCVTSGTLKACRQHEDLLFLSREGKQIGDFHIQAHDCLDEHGGNQGPCETPILSLEWSPDGKWLLVEGLADLHETYYFLVDPVALKLREVATAFPDSMIWLPRREELLYDTTMQTAPLPGSRGERQVWVQHLMVLNAATGTSRAITSGISNNVDAALCRK